MYYVDNDDPLDRKSCIRNGPPHYYWKNDPTLTNIPDEEASQLDENN